MNCEFWFHNLLGCGGRRESTHLLVLVSQFVVASVEFFNVVFCALISLSLYFG